MGQILVVFSEYLNFIHKKMNVEKSHNILILSQMISPESQNTQWSIRFVTMFSAHGSSPEIMPKQLCNGIMWSKILVIYHSTDIIKHKTTWEAIDVDQNTEQGKSKLMPSIPMMYHDLSWQQ